MRLTASQFNQAISFCRKDGMVRDCEAYLLYQIAGSLPRGARALEIGCWKGKSSIAIGWGLEMIGGHLDTVDNFAGVENSPEFGTGREVREAFEKNVGEGGTAARTTLHDMSAQQFSKEWTTPVDFLFIDGCHVYESVRHDVFAFMKYVKPGAWAAFHDIRDKHSVIRAIREYLKQEQDWAIEALAWDSNLLAFRRASSPGVARSRWLIEFTLKLAPLSCRGIPLSRQPVRKWAVKLVQSFSRFILRHLTSRPAAA